MATTTSTLQVHAKAWTAAAGTILNFIILLAQQVVGFLPPQWAAAVSGLIALLTVFGVYKVPNATPAAPAAEKPPTGSPWPSA